MRDQVSGKKQRSEVGQARSSQAYDERAAKNKVGGAQLSLCFTCCGKFLHDNPKHYVRRAFWNKDPVECVAKWGGEFLRTAWIHVATDSTRGRNPTKQAQHQQAVLKGMEKYVEENVILVQFFYQEMKEEEVSQEINYDHFKLIGDVGGQLGLLLGASVLTLVEFVDLFFFILYHQVLRLYRGRVRRRETNNGDVS